MAEGVTTLEIKSGYGLTPSTRRAACASRAGSAASCALDGAHHLPGGARAAAGVRRPRRRLHRRGRAHWLPALHAEGLVDAVDAFCERIGFTPAQTRRVFEAARALGLPVKLHAEQLSDQGGAALAARVRRAVVRPPRAPERRRRAGDGRGRHASRCCCPARSTSCARRKLPPVAALRDAGVPIAHRHRPQPRLVADAVAAADAEHGLHAVPPDARGGAARRHRERARARSACTTAARSRAGQRADFVVWDVEHPNELAYWFGRNPCCAARRRAAACERPP